MCGVNKGFTFIFLNLEFQLSSHVSQRGFRTGCLACGKHQGCKGE